MKDFSSIKLKSEGITDERILNTLLKYEKKDFFPNEKNSLINSDIDFIDEKSFMVLRTCLLYTSPSPRDRQKSRMPSSA